MLLAALFALGAALSALGGDTVVSILETTTAAACGGSIATTASEPQPAGDPSPDCGSATTAETTTASTETTTVPETTAAETTSGATETTPPTTPTATTTTTGETTSASGNQSGSGAGHDGGQHAGTGGDGPGSASILQPVGPPDEAPPAIDPEAAAASDALVWLHRTLPDPGSRTRRLAPGFARVLRVVSRRHDVAWPFVLAVVRAGHGSARFPASRARIDRVASRLAGAGLDRRRADLGPHGGAWQKLLTLRGRTTFADRVLALARYDRALGLHGLVAGLEDARRRLTRRVLRDGRIEIYSGGRSDVAAGRVNVRILVLLRYLRIGFGRVTVSSLVAGHRLYSRPGVVSAHAYGLAVDITSLGGVPIVGHQQPASVTEHAVADILLLPRELRPRQVISLLGLGGPSFALADHYDHLHVGF